LTLTIALVVLAVFVLFVRRAIVTYRIRKTEWECMDSVGMHHGLELLLKRGYDGAFAVFTDHRSERFLQFRKYIQANRQIGLEMHFPRALWSESYYADVLDLFGKRGF